MEISGSVADKQRVVQCEADLEKASQKLTKLVNQIATWILARESGAMLCLKSSPSALDRVVSLYSDAAFKLDRAQIDEAPKIPRDPLFGAALLLVMVPVCVVAVPVLAVVKVVEIFSPGPWGPPATMKKKNKDGGDLEVSEQTVNEQYVAQCETGLREASQKLTELVVRTTKDILGRKSGAIRPLQDGSLFTHSTLDTAVLEYSAAAFQLHRAQIYGAPDIPASTGWFSAVR